MLQVAKRFVDSALNYSKDIVIGSGMQGPFDYFLSLKKDTQSYWQSTVNTDDLFLYAVTDSRINKKWNISIVDAVKAAMEGGATIVQLKLTGASFWIQLFVHVFLSNGSPLWHLSVFAGSNKLKLGSLMKKQSRVLTYAGPMEFVCW